VNIEGVMVAAGKNLKRLIKHNLRMLFSFLESTPKMLIQPPNIDFFNRLGPLLSLYSPSSEGPTNHTHANPRSPVKST